MASVQLRAVEKSFGGTQVIRGVNVEVKDGQFVVLVGPSGCGKSTLLRMLAGLEQISGGEILIDGRVVNTLSPKERDVAMVFQNYALYPHMTVFDNMAFSLMLAQTDREEIRKRVDKASEILGLSQLLKRYPRQLSGGQRQRVAMGRAIVRNPQVFLFDEPLSNLDAKLRVQMRAEIRALHQRLQATSVYVTHDQIEAMTMGDLIVVMNDGRVEQQGQPLDLYDRPDNLFVASFIGSPTMNLLPGVLHRNADGDQVHFANGTLLPVPQSASGLGQDGQKVLYGVRPEHLSMATSDHGLEAVVTVVEPTGADTEVHARIDSVDVVAVFRERQNLHPGDTVFLAPDLAFTHLFDEGSGKAMRQ
jgi:multiple sugar transport system ATP-binding protein